LQTLFKLTLQLPYSLESQSKYRSFWQSTGLSRCDRVHVGRGHTSDLLRFLGESRSLQVLLDDGEYWEAFNRVLHWLIPVLSQPQSTVLCLGSATVTMHPKFRSPAFRTRRTILYTSLALTAIVYVLHGILLHGWHVQRLRMSLMWLLFATCLFMFGAGLYALRVCVLPSESV
jgi:hypothetical protein